MSETKACSKCGVEKERSEFYGCKRAKDGKQSACKACKTVYRRKSTGAVPRVNTNRYEDGKLIINSTIFGKQTVLYDAEDAHLIEPYIWSVARGGNTLYVKRNGNWRKRESGTLMHRDIMKPNKDMVIDHINHNGLDNRRINLRICTKAQNECNRPAQKKNPTGFKGVSDARAYSSINPYMAKIAKRGKQYYLGYYATPEEAARAYDAKAKELHGEFAYLNFPDE